jgi:rhodanese-related sulfurtransferase
VHQDLIVYCGHGPRATLAGRALRRHGFTRVEYLDGHFSTWRREGRPEER